MYSNPTKPFQKSKSKTRFRAPVFVKCCHSFLTRVRGLALLPGVEGGPAWHSPGSGGQDCRAAHACSVLATSAEERGRSEAPLCWHRGPPLVDSKAERTHVNASVSRHPFGPNGTDLHLKMGSILLGWKRL